MRRMSVDWGTQDDAPSSLRVVASESRLLIETIRNVIKRLEKAVEDEEKTTQDLRATIAAAQSQQLALSVGGGSTGFYASIGSESAKKIEALKAQVATSEAALASRERILRSLFGALRNVQESLSQAMMAAGHLAAKAIDAEQEAQDASSRRLAALDKYGHAANVLDEIDILRAQKNTLRESLRFEQEEDLEEEGGRARKELAEAREVIRR